MNVCTVKNYFIFFLLPNMIDGCQSKMQFNFLWIDFISVLLYEVDCNCVQLLCSKWAENLWFIQVMKKIIMMDGYACTVQYAKWMLKSYSVSNWRVIKNESNVDHEVDVVYKSKCVLNDLLRFIWQMVQLTRPSCKWIY